MQTEKRTFEENNKQQVLATKNEEKKEESNFGFDLAKNLQRRSCDGRKRYGSF